MNRAVRRAKQKAKQHRIKRFIWLGSASVVVAAAIGVAVFMQFRVTPHAVHPASHNIAKKQNKPTQTAALPVITKPSLPVHDYQLPPIADGKVPVISRISTKQKVVFLTIDDGIVTNSQDAALMKNAQVKATFFLVHRFIVNDYQYFADLAQQTGSDIENHSYDHYELINKPYDQQKTDICMNADVFTQWFGKRPLIFRPSGGAYDDTTQKAAAACGMKALVLWDAAINNGTVKYQAGKMQPGDIVLMHFRATFPEDLNAFVKDAHNAGLQPELLTDWLQN